VIKDFKIENEGSIILFEPLTDAARSWWKSNVDPDAMTIYSGRAYVVEHRYAGDIIEGIKTA
jgi:hypothetical protein